MNVLQSPKEKALNYLNLSRVDPSALGFLLILLGGSRADSAPPTDPLTDWDGIGIVARRGQIVNLVENHRQALSELLRIAKEECLSWEGFNSSPAGPASWDLVRFSGLGEDGTKRTIKIWSMESLIATFSSPEMCRLGVLSSRRLYSFDRGRDANKMLNIFQPRIVSDNLSIIEDVDFITHSDGHPVSPGVTCDLLLTAVPVYVTSSSLLRLVKSQAATKWSLLSKCTITETLIDKLHSSWRFSDDYRQCLFKSITEYIEVAVDDSLLRSEEFQDEPLIIPSPPYLSLIHQVDSLDKGSTRLGYAGVRFLGPSSWTPCAVNTKLRQEASAGTSSSSPLASTLADSTLTLTHSTPLEKQSPFTSNSTCYYAHFSACAENEDQREVFVKSGPGVPAEFAILPTILRHFPPQLLQRCRGYTDATGIVYDRFKGISANDIRLELKTNAQSSESNAGGMSNSPWTERTPNELFRSLVGIELARSHHVLSVLLSTFNESCPESVGGQSNANIHRFYHGRLHLNNRFQGFYEGSNASFLRTLDDPSLLTLSEFMDLPLIINGEKYPSLESQFRMAEAILNPTGSRLQKGPIAFGLGDGHGGNLMISTTSTEGLRFIDYEVAGYHNPVLDQAKPLYLDGFFSVLYYDFIPSQTDLDVQWDIDAEAITIDCRIAFDLVDRVLAFIKLDCVLGPILERLEPAEIETSIELLSAALFTNSLLTRNFSNSPPKVFFLNCAVGIMLMHDLKSTLRSFFGWDRWPSLDDRALVPVSRSNPEVPFILDDASLMSLVEAFLHQTINATTLEPETVFLKRFEDTLELHSHFSKDQGESSDVVISRIGKARKLGMKIAPHTCIRESIFAEPRVDRHFLYQSVLGMARDPGPVAKKLVDVGCCMGSDIRKLILDGFEAKNILGIDLEEGYFRLGVMLYNEGSDSPFKFRQADVLADDFFRNNQSLESAFDFVHSANVIHLFDEARQIQFLRVMAFLAKPGGLMWGRQVGLLEDENMETYRHWSGKGTRFTASEFEVLILEATGWERDDMAYQSQVVKYTELREARKYKGWVLQWSYQVPETKIQTTSKRFGEESS